MLSELHYPRDETSQERPCVGIPPASVLAGESPNLRIDPEPNTAFEQLLANPSATALNQNDEHYNEQNAGNNPDNRDIFHVDSPFFLIKSIS